jgi:high-affinity nickel permease
MIALLSILVLGFFLGMRHATDPDHVIAVATIVTRQRSLARAALIGAWWGLGHTITILVVGSGIILFNLVIPTRIGLSMELSVGIMLVILGIANIAGFLRSVPEPEAQTVQVHVHAHTHGDFIHSHAHTHEAEAHPHAADQNPVSFIDKKLARSNLYQHLRPLFVGIVHGLAGSAAVALLVLTTIRNPSWAVAYLLIFGVGTIAGMMVITMSLASTLKFVGRSQLVAQRLAMASGLLSLAFGCFVIYEMGFVNGLFTSHPIWTPK